MNIAEIQMRGTEQIIELEDIIDKHGSFFVHPSDLEYMKKSIMCIKRHISRQLNNLGKHNLSLYNHSKLRGEVIDKITANAHHYESTGILEYLIQGRFMIAEQISREIAQYSRSKFIGAKEKLKLHSINYAMTFARLDSETSVQIEHIFSYIDKKERGQKQGVVFFNPSEDSFTYEIGRRLVNFACNRGRKNKRVSGDDVIYVKENYFDQSTKDLHKLSDRLHAEMNSPHSVNMRPFEHYQEIIPRLAEYMASIDSVNYDIHGLACAIPLKLAKRSITS